MIAVLHLSIGTGIAGENPPDEETLPTDPRMIEANSLMSDEPAHDRVVALYREVLAENPEHRMARVWLARVLSWRSHYDDALAEYDEILRREERPRWALRERANVLAWAGQLERAEAEFKELLADEPDDFDLNLALARAYSWSGRSGEARTAYKRTLEIREDAEARAEMEAVPRVQNGMQLGGDGEGRFVRDSDGLEIWRVKTGVQYPINPKTKAWGRLGYVQIHGTPRGTSNKRRLDAGEWMLGLHRRASEALTFDLGLGARHWERAPGHFLLHSSLSYSPGDKTSLGVALEYGDFLERSDSIDSVQRGLDHTSLRLSVWRSLGGTAEAFGQLTSTFVSDGNESISIYLDSSAKPWAAHSLRLSLSASSTNYTGRSADYYDPKADVGGALSVSALWPVTGGHYHDGRGGRGGGDADRLEEVK